MDNKIDGKAVAAQTRANVAQAVSTLSVTPTLAVVLVGDDPASHVYVRNKIKFTEETGMRSLEHRLPETATQDDVVEIVRALNADAEVDGILVQLPLPDHIDSDAVIAEIDPAKDVDGLTDVSAGRLVLGQAGRINRVPSVKRPGKFRLVGDVDYKPARAVAGAITPVPGGVGPMTIACLLRNTVLAACDRRGLARPSILEI